MNVNSKIACRMKYGAMWHPRIYTWPRVNFVVCICMLQNKAKRSEKILTCHVELFKNILLQMAFQSLQILTKNHSIIINVGKILNCNAQLSFGHHWLTTQEGQTSTRKHTSGDAPLRSSSEPSNFRSHFVSRYF